MEIKFKNHISLNSYLEAQLLSNWGVSHSITDNVTNSSVGHFYVVFESILTVFIWLINLLRKPFMLVRGVKMLGFGGPVDLV